MSTLFDPMDPSKILCLWDFLGKNSGVGCHFLLQGIFLNQGSNLHFLGLLHCRQMCFRSLNWEDVVEKEMATHSTILAWEILWTEEPGGL